MGAPRPIFIDGISKAMKSNDRPLYDDAPMTGAPVRPAPSDEALRTLVKRVPEGLRLGTCGWASPGWRGSIYAPSSGTDTLPSAAGLAAYARYPLVNTVSLERHAQRPYGASDLEAFAAAVPEHFRFTVLMPADVTDPFLRRRDGVPAGDNPYFLDVAAAADRLALIAQSLGTKCGPVLLEFAPFPREWTADATALQQTVGRLEAFLGELKARSPDGTVLGAELRTPALLTPRFVSALNRVGVRPVMGLHHLMPVAVRQSRALRHAEDPRDENPDWRFSGPLIVRWSRSAPLAHVLRLPGNTLPASDPTTRAVISSLAVRALKSKMPAWILAGNRAEGSAPGTLRAILEAVVRQYRESR